MSNNVNTTAGRQSHITAAGVYLERKYLYLAPELWDSLHFISKSSGLSASEYLAKIIKADNGQSVGINNDSPRTRN